MQLGAAPPKILKASNGEITSEKCPPSNVIKMQPGRFGSRHSREFLHLKVPDSRLLRPAILMPKHQAGEGRVAAAAAEGILGAANRPRATG